METLQQLDVFISRDIQIVCLPDSRKFANAYCHLFQTGQFSINTNGKGNPRFLITPLIKEAIFNDLKKSTTVKF